MKTINIGLVGFGTVGVGVVRLFQEQAVLLERRVGAQLRVKRIADIDLTRVRDVEVDPSILTSDAREVTEDKTIDIVIELIGMSFARSLKTPLTALVSIESFSLVPVPCAEM